MAHVVQQLVVAVVGVGIVHDDPVVLAETDFVHSSRNGWDVLKFLDYILQVQTGLIQGAGNGQQVVQVVSHLQVGGYRIFLAFVNQREGHAFRTVDDIFCHVIRRLFNGVGHEFAGAQLFDALSVRIVDVHHRHGGRLQIPEEQGFGLEVILHILEIIQVFPGEVGEDGIIEIHRAHALLNETVGADLNGRRLGSVPAHLLQGPLQRDDVRRGQGNIVFLSFHLAADGAQISALALVLGVNLADQIGNGRFAVGSGDTEHGEVLAGPSVQRSRRLVQRIQRAWNLDVNDTFLILHRHIVFIDNYFCPVINRLFCEIVSVQSRTVDAEKHIAFLYLAGIDA